MHFLIVCKGQPYLFLTGTLPSPKETIKGNIKTITEYKIDDDGKKFKVIWLLFASYMLHAGHLFFIGDLNSEQQLDDPAIALRRAYNAWLYK